MGLFGTFITKPCQKIAVKVGLKKMVLWTTASVGAFTLLQMYFKRTNRRMMPIPVVAIFCSMTALGSFVLTAHNALYDCMYYEAYHAQNPAPK